MSRCSICDASSDTDVLSSRLRFTYHKERDEYICSKCDKEIEEAVQDLLPHDEESFLRDYLFKNP